MVHKRFLQINLENFFCYVLLILFGSVLMISDHAGGADCENMLTVRVSPARSGNITSPQFPTNPTVYPSVFVLSKKYILTAVPEEGYEFAYWTVNYTTATANPLTVSVVDGQKTVTAFFRVPEPPPNIPPTADAGVNQAVTPGGRVTLDGSGSFDSDDGIKSYLWQQTSGASVTLSNAAAVSPTFTAPEISTDPVILTFQLTVEDFDGAINTDSVIITVREYINIPPTADAGDNQVVLQGSQVTLDGSGSFDPDDGIKSYYWQQAAGSSVTLTETSTVTTTFTAPEVFGEPITLEFKLTVEDFAGAAAVASVHVIVQCGVPSGPSGSSSGCFISGAVR